MKLAFVIFEYFYHGGLQKSFFSILKEMVKRGHDITIFASRWEGDTVNGARLQLLPVDAITNHKATEEFAQALQNELKKLTTMTVVGFNKMPYLDIYYCGDICYLDYILNHKKPWTVPFIKALPRYKSYRALEGEIFEKNKTTAVLSISKTHDKNYMACYGTEPNRFHALPPGIKKERFSAVRSKSSDTSLSHTDSDLLRLINADSHHSIFLMVGSDFRRKGVDRVIQALSLIHQPLLSKIKLVIVGRGKQQRYQGRIRRSELENSVHFIGPSKIVPQWLKLSTALIHAAYFETAGSAILEAMVAGKPVFATENCGFAFHVQQAKAGKVLPNDHTTPHVLASAIQESIENRELYKQWCDNAIQYTDTEDLYSRPKVAADWIEKLANSHHENSEKC